MCLSVCGGQGRVRGQLSVLVPLFYHMCPRNQAQVFKVGSKATFTCGAILPNIKPELHSHSATQRYLTPEFLGCSKETAIAPLWVTGGKVYSKLPRLSFGKAERSDGGQRVIRELVPGRKGVSEELWWGWWLK